MEEVKEEELIKNFKSVEKKLCSAIKKMPNKIQDSNTDEILKLRIKSYILQINELKALLDEYEQIALAIEKISNKKKDGEEINRAVVDLRQEKINTNIKSAVEIIYSLENEEKERLEKYEHLIVEGKVVGVKKKKSNKNIKEF